MFKTKRFKSILCIMIVMSISLSMVVFGQAEDTTAEWIMKGWSKVNGEEELNLQANISRIEFTALINSLFEFKDKGKNLFKDISEEDVYFNEVLKAVGAGIINGYGNGEFFPSGEITKAEAYVMLSRALNLEELEEINLIKNFTDYEDIPNWAKSGIEGLSQKGMLVDKKKVKPIEKLTGEEAVAIIKTAHSTLDVTTKDDKDAAKETKGNGKSPLNYLESFVSKIVDNVSMDVSKIEKEIEFEEDMYIKLVFDRGMVGDNWDNNRSQIYLMDKDGNKVESKIQRIADSDNEKSFIFVKPVDGLKKGASYKIVINKDLKANNGNSLGEDVIIEFVVK